MPPVTLLLGMGVKCTRRPEGLDGMGIMSGG